MRPTIGVLGGMGPAATAQFLTDLTAEETRQGAETDQDHLEVLIYSHTLIPDRTPNIVAGLDAPLRPLRDGIERVLRWGADILAVPCNTAHFYINRFLDEIPVPFVHIVRETLRAAQEHSPEGAWLTATNGTVATELYQETAQKMGYELWRPNPEQQERIMHVVYLVKEGKFGPAGELDRAVLSELLNKREGMIVTACTELPLAYPYSGLPAELEISSSRALAQGVVRVAREWEQEHSQ